MIGPFFQWVFAQIYIIFCNHLFAFSVGRPIVCERIPNPTDEQVDKLREQYKEALVQMFNRYRPLYDPTAEDIRFFWGHVNWVTDFLIPFICLFTSISLLLIL